MDTYEALQSPGQCEPARSVTPAECNVYHSGERHMHLCFGTSRQGGPRCLHRLPSPHGGHELGRGYHVQAGHTPASKWSRSGSGAVLGHNGPKLGSVGPSWEPHGWSWVLLGASRGPKIPTKNPRQIPDSQEEHLGFVWDFFVAFLVPLGGSLGGSKGVLGILATLLHQMDWIGTCKLLRQRTEVAYT